MSNNSLVSIKEIIDLAFGDPEVNIVNFKLIQTILYLLARQLRILDRKVETNIGPYPVLTSSSLSVIEVKVHAIAPPKKKKKGKAVPEKSESQLQQTIASADKSKHRGISTGSVQSYDTSQTQHDQQTHKVTIPGSDQTSSTTYNAPDDDDTKKYEKGPAGSEGNSRLVQRRVHSTLSIIPSGGTDIDEKSVISQSLRRISSKAEVIEVNHNLVEEEEIQRERVLRVIEQRADSREEPDKDPRAMAGVPSTEILQEKILIVERVRKHDTDPEKADEREGRTRKSKAGVAEERGGKGRKSIAGDDSDEREGRAGRKSKAGVADDHTGRDRKSRVGDESDKRGGKTRKSRTGEDSVPSRSSTDRGKVLKLNVVTKEEFEALEEEVRELQSMYNVGSPGFPENIQLMKDLRRGASLSDAMSALQLSARLEANEKALEKMSIIMAELAKTPPGQIAKKGEGTSAGKAPKVSIIREPSEVVSKSVSSRNTSSGVVLSAPQLPTKVSHTQEERAAFTLAKEPIADDGEGQTGTPDDIITHADLQESYGRLYDQIMRDINNTGNQNIQMADNALKTAKALEKKIDAALAVGTRMDVLEDMFSAYAAKINSIDAGLSYQMTHYQELLTQLQHELETSLDNVAEALANASGDPVAVAEMNGRFTALQMDFEHTHASQRKLKETILRNSTEIQALWKIVDNLRDMKCDRDEVEDALKDKAGQADLNGLVRIDQFSAVRGDLEKRIAAAYDKFNNQETTWQKAIDDLVRELNEKVDTIQVISLRDEVNHHLKNLRARAQDLADILGEPNAAAVSRQLLRDAACISCATPANLELATKLKLHTKKGVDGDLSRTGDGDHGHGQAHGLCYPGHPIPHPVDHRAQFCQRYCGGAHTITNTSSPRAPTGIVLKSFNRETTLGYGSDGKAYKIDDRRPCIPCNRPASPVEAPTVPIFEAEPLPEQSVSATAGPVVISERPTMDLSMEPDPLTTPPMERLYSTELGIPSGRGPSVDMPVGSVSVTPPAFSSED